MATLWPAWFGNRTAQLRVCAGGPDRLCDMSAFETDSIPPSNCIAGMDCGACGHPVFVRPQMRDADRCSHSCGSATAIFYVQEYAGRTMAAKTITALRVSEKSQGRIQVFLDEEYAFSLTAIVAAPLHIGQRLSDDDIEALQTADLQERAWERALKFLSYRARSEAEIRRYLAENKFGDVEDQVVERLYRLGYLNDQAFAQAWVASRNAQRPKGPRALRFELRSKGIASDVIEEALADLSADETAYAAVRKSAARWFELDPGALRQKVHAFLARRGFDYETIRTTTERLLRESGAGAQPDDE